MTVKMDKDLRDVWVDALRSGEYHQIQDEITDGHGYCCLGVLAQVAGVDVNGELCEAHNNTDAYELTSEQDVLVNGMFWGCDTGLSHDDARDLVSMNDSKELQSDFDDIADYIEGHYA